MSAPLFYFTVGTAHIFFCSKIQENKSWILHPKQEQAAIANEIVSRANSIPRIRDSLFLAGNKIEDRSRHQQLSGVRGCGGWGLKPVVDPVVVIPGQLKCFEARARTRDGSSRWKNGRSRRQSRVGTTYSRCAWGYYVLGNENKQGLIFFFWCWPS